MNKYMAILDAILEFSARHHLCQCMPVVLERTVSLFDIKLHFIIQGVRVLIIFGHECQ